MEPYAMEAQGTSKSFDGASVLSDVSFKLRRGSLTGLIGPNGAGKSTLFDVLSGALRPDQGRVYLHGQDVTRRSVAGRARNGLGRTFQYPRLIPNRSALENVLLAADVPNIRLILGGSPPSATQEEARDALRRVGMADLALGAVDRMNVAQQRCVELARVLVRKPQVLLLDEPTVGLSADEEAVLATLLRDLNKEGTTLLVISHAIPFLAFLATDMVALAAGRLIAEGSPESVCSDPFVREAYLGV